MKKPEIERKRKKIEKNNTKIFYSKKKISKLYSFNKYRRILKIYLLLIKKFRNF